MKETRHTQRGYTLIEVMIAALIFAIAMMAVMSMEFTALKAYSGAKHQTVATSIGARTIAYAEAEAVNWAKRSVGSGRSDAVDAMSVDISLQPLYSVSAAGRPPFNRVSDTAIIERITKPEWTWQLITAEPVNERLSAPTDTSTEALDAVYCVYARGGFSQHSLTAGQTATSDTADPVATVTPLIQMHVAVTYPLRQGNFAGVSGPNRCAQLPGCGDVTTNLLDPRGLTSLITLPPLEECGWGAVYKSAVVMR